MSNPRVASTLSAIPFWGEQGARAAFGGETFFGFYFAYFFGFRKSLPAGRGIV